MCQHSKLCQMPLGNREGRAVRTIPSQETCPHVGCAESFGGKDGMFFMPLPLPANGSSPWYTSAEYGVLLGSGNERAKA
jgi:hypothetical protein